MKKQKKQATTHFPCYGRAPRPLKKANNRHARLLKCLTLCCVLWLLPLAKGYCQQQPGGPFTANKNNCIQQWQVDGTRFDGLNVSVSDIFGEDEGYFPVGCGGVFYCGRNHLFTTYTNTTSVIHLTNTLHPTLGNLDTFEFIVRFNNTLAPVPGTGQFLSTYAGLANHPLALNSAIKGQYNIECWYRDPAAGWTMVKSATISVIPKIDRVWVEAQELCGNLYSTTADNKYHFKIKTSPDIISTMITTPQYYVGSVYSNTTGCQKADRVSIGIDANAIAYTSTGIPTGNPFVVSSIYAAGNISLTTPNDNSVRGSLWPYNGAITPTNESDFYIDLTTSNGNYTLLDYITGSQKGLPVKINVHVTDGVLLDQTFDAPLIIHAPITTTGNTSAANYASGYDTTRYTLPAGSTQIWSPTSDPVFAHYGDPTDPATLRIRDSLVIPAGTSLTIQGRRLELGPKGRIVIEAGKNGREGGFLKLDNATVTQYQTKCFPTNYMWSGIEVRGDRTKDQLPGVNGLGAQWQGAIDIENYSELSYAKVGIITWNPAGPYSSSGGVITARASHFLNNGVAVQVLPYTAPAYGPNNSIIDPYRASFTNCDFDITSALSTPFSAHLSGERVSGVSVRGCRFSNSYSGTGIGINGFDFNVRVDRSLTGLASYTPTRFTGLQQGMKMGAVIGTNGAFSVRNSEFTTSVNGVWSNGVQFPVITDNRFVMTGGNIIVQSVGTAVYTGAHYLITRNTYNAQKSGQTAGVAIRNAGSTAASVFVNSYGDLFTGNLSNDLNQGLDAQGKPAGLQFLCNDYKSNKFGEAARGSNPNQHGMSKSQGSPTVSAGNTFSANNKDIYNPLNEVVPVTYYQKGGGVYLPANNIGVSIGNSTAASSCDFSSGTGGTQDPRDPIKGLRMAQHVGDAFNDSTGRMNRDSAYYWLDQMQTPYSDLTKTDLLLESGRAEEASSVYNSIATTYEMPEQEAVEFKVWGRKLLNLRMALLAAGRQPNELSNAQVDTLNQVAEGATMWAQVRAQNWLSLYDGRDFERSFLFPEDSAAPQARKTNIASAINYSVYPNPVSEYLSVAYTNASDKGAVMQITDVVGRVISETNLEGRSGNLNIDVRNFQSGVYLYRILESGKTMQTGKVTKQ